MLAVIILSHDIPVLGVAFLCAAVSQFFPLRVRFHVWLGVALFLGFNLVFAEPVTPIWTQINDHQFLAGSCLAAVSVAIHMFFTLKKHTDQIAKLEVIAETTTKGFGDVEKHIAALRVDVDWIKKNLEDK